MAQRKPKQNKEIVKKRHVKVDWYEVADLYTRDMKTVSELARYTGYSRGKVLNELKKCGAYKDNTEDIGRRANVKMATDGRVNKTTREGGQGILLSDTDTKRVIEAEAERIAQVQLKQRHQVAMLMEELEQGTILLRAERKIVQKVLASTSDQNYAEATGGAMEDLTEGELEMLDKSNKARKFLTPSYLRDEIGKLAQAYAKTIPLERQLHGLDKPETAGGAKEEEAKRKFSDEEMQEQVHKQIEDMMENIFKKAGETK